VTGRRSCAVALRRDRGLRVEVAGVVRTDLGPGESVSAAAARAVHEALGVPLEPWAVDLSGDCGWLAVDVPDAVRVDDLGSPPADERLEKVARIPAVSAAFRAMTPADYRDVVRWQSQPYVARWWQDEARDVAAAEAHYGPALDGNDPTRMWVLEVNGRSVGMLQDYRIGDHPEWALLTARPDAVGFDYLLGDPAWVGRGVGTRALWVFLRDVVAPAYPGATEFFASPNHLNAASLRVLDKLGFVRGLWFDEPVGNGRVETLVACSLDVRRVLG
jgi:aminoglycoside 6'-N-acetyltransferase